MMKQDISTPFMNKINHLQKSFVSLDCHMYILDSNYRLYIIIGIRCQLRFILISKKRA